MKRRLLLVVLLIFSSLASGEVRTLTILHSNDLHARLLPLEDGRGGFARLATAVRRERAGSSACLYLNAGDLVECALPWSEAMSAAERIGGAHTMMLGVRGMDLLNVAAAVATKSRVFLTFDARRRAIAQAAGLKVLP